MTVTTVNPGLGHTVAMPTIHTTTALPQVEASPLAGPLNENWLVSIGNTDDRLGQAEWAAFIADLVELLESYAVRWHGRWYSSPTDPWQNANMCFQLPEATTLAAYMAHAHDLEVSLARLARQYRQDSIAVTRGPVRFIRAAAW